MTRSTDAALEAAAVAASLDAYAARIVGGELVGTYHRLACARQIAGHAEPARLHDRRDILREGDRLRSGGRPAGAAGGGDKCRCHEP